MLTKTCKILHYWYHNISMFILIYFFLYVWFLLLECDEISVETCGSYIQGCTLKLQNDAYFMLHDLLTFRHICFLRYFVLDVNKRMSVMVRKVCGERFWRSFYNQLKHILVYEVDVRRNNREIGALRTPIAVCCYCWNWEPVALLLMVSHPTWRRGRPGT